MPREPASGFGRAALKSDLKLLGFEDCLAENIANQVDRVKGQHWTYDMGRQEAVRQAQMLFENSHAALDTFRERSMPSMRQQRERSVAERIADSSLLFEP